MTHGGPEVTPKRSLEGAAAVLEQMTYTQQTAALRLRRSNLPRISGPNAAGTERALKRLGVVERFLDDRGWKVLRLTSPLGQEVADMILEATKR